MCTKGHTWESTYSIVRQGGWCMMCAKQNDKIERLNEFKEIAASYGGSCLSQKYITTNVKLKWLCKNGHTFLLTPHNVKQGYWCRRCSHDEVKRKSFEKVKALAEKKGGKCLSLDYKGKLSRLKWQCSKGHTWLMVASNISAGLWCKYCNKEKRAKKELRSIQLMAEKKGGKCLSPQYSGKGKSHTWQCAEGHVWSTAPIHIQKTNGSWCPICTRKHSHDKEKRFSTGQLRKHARDRGGQLLSREYINGRVPLSWQCKKGHIWKANARPVVKGDSWCPICSEKTRPSTEKFRELAKKRGGKLLSEYKNAKTHLKWQCSKGHIWLAVGNAVKVGSWCPVCAGKKRKLTMK